MSESNPSTGTTDKAPPISERVTQLDRRLGPVLSTDEHPYETYSEYLNPDQVDETFLTVRAFAKDPEESRRLGDRLHSLEVFDRLRNWLETEVVLRMTSKDGVTAIIELAAELQTEADAVGRQQLAAGSDNANDWSPLISRDPSRRPPEDLASWLGESLADRLAPTAGPAGLAVVVGPGVLQARVEPTETIEWPAAVVAASDSHTASFAERLWTARAGSRQPDLTNTPGSDELSSLRIALLTAARVAAEAFRDGWAADSPVTSWDHHAVLLAPTALRDVRATIETAATHAEEAAHLVGQLPKFDLLGADILGLRLRRLARLIAEGDAGGRPPERLLGVEVNWLTDCAWHAMMFRSATYPDLRELTLQVELCTGREDGPVRSLEPPATISRWSPGDLADAAAAAMRRGWSKDKPHAKPHFVERRELYDLLARRLWSEAGHRRYPAPPVAVVTTFDLEMERALAACATRSDRDFHVLVPVLEPSPAAHSVMFRWLLGSYPSACDGSTLAGLRSPTWLRAREAPQPTGPVVVKINGSPLHLLPSVAEQPSEDQPMTAALLLREFDCMDLTQIGMVANVNERNQQRKPEVSEEWSSQKTPPLPPSDSALPIWMLDALASPRRQWMVLGARFADWNARSQLHSLLSWPTAKGDRRSTPVYAFGPEFEDVRSELLRWLNVELVKADCLDLIPALRDLNGLEPR